MNRDKALKILLVLLGVLFVAGLYPLITSVRSGWQANREDAEPMALSLYVTLGIFLLLAAQANTTHTFSSPVCKPATPEACAQSRAHGLFRGIGCALAGA